MSTERFELQKWESMSLLKSQGVGRIAIIDQGHPIALPVNFRLVGTESEPSVVIRTAHDTMLGRYTGLASLEVDQIDLERRQAWSVIARGRLRHAVGAHGLPDPGPLLHDDRHMWVVLEITSVSGRKFVGRTEADGVTVDWELDPGPV